MADKDMTIFCKHLEGEQEKLWAIVFPKGVFDDIEGRPDDGVRGTFEYTPGDRIAYHSAWVNMSHEDPGHHPSLVGFRFHFQATGDVRVQINDKYMAEMHPQAQQQYPYDPQLPAPPYYDGHPGGEVLMAHHRPSAPQTKLVLQLMGIFKVPGESPQNPKVKWYYQGSGLFIAVHEEYGPITRLQVASMHPRYVFAIRGLPGPRFSFLEQRLAKIEAAG